MQVDIHVAYLLILRGHEEVGVSCDPGCVALHLRGQEEARALCFVFARVWRAMALFPRQGKEQNAMGGRSWKVFPLLHNEFQLYGRRRIKGRVIFIDF